MSAESLLRRLAVAARKVSVALVGVADRLNPPGEPKPEPITGAQFLAWADANLAPRTDEEMAEALGTAPPGEPAAAGSASRAKRRWGRLPAEVQDRIRQLVTDGFSADEIARRIGVSKSVVRRYRPPAVRQVEAREFFDQAAAAVPTPAPPPAPVPETPEPPAPVKRKNSCFHCGQRGHRAPACPQRHVADPVVAGAAPRCQLCGLLEPHECIRIETRRTP